MVDADIHTADNHFYIIFVIEGGKELNYKNNPNFHSKICNRSIGLALLQKNSKNLA